MKKLRSSVMLLSASAMFVFGAHATHAAEVTPNTSVTGPEENSDNNSPETHLWIDRDTSAVNHEEHEETQSNPVSDVDIDENH